MEGRGSSIYLGLRVPWGQSIYCFGHMDLRARRHLGRQCGGIRRRSGCQGAGTTCSEVPAGSSPPRPQCSGRRSGPCREEIRTNVKQWQVREKQLRILLVTFRQILSKATTSCKLLPSSCIDADLLLAPPAKVPAAPEDAPVRLEAAKTNSGPAGDLWTRWKSSCRTSSTVLQVLSGIFNKSYGLQECLILLWHRVSADLGGGLV